MHSSEMTEDSRLSCWRRVRAFAVPPPMIDQAAARRAVGDWAGACAAAHVDVDLHPRSTARTHGREIAARLRDDLRHLAPDLLRWHLPRATPQGLILPGLTISLARYATGDGRPLHLVARTPPASAAGGQRFSLGVWDGSSASAGRHPRPRPHRRFRLDLHRHLWDASHAGELRTRAGVHRALDRAWDEPRPDRAVPAGWAVSPGCAVSPAWAVPEDRTSPPGRAGPPGWAAPAGCAVDHWAAEAEILLRADGRAEDAVAVRLGARRLLALRLAGPGPELAGVPRVASRLAALPVLPDAATWLPPDLLLLRAGLIDPGQLHPLVAEALVPGSPRPGPAPDGGVSPWLVDCGGVRHRIGLVDGVLVPLDHDPAEIRREELLTALSGTPLPCLRVIDEAYRHPEHLDDIRARLDHGDFAGALAVVEALLGPEAVLRDGALRDELMAAARGRIAHGLFRSGLADRRGPHASRRRDHDRRRRPRQAHYR
ncbi:MULTISPECIES: hypothetical protein [unclassified Pseudofrankia]|uniref:hypothetical protein n=1 Tax=unclassified Pseudofrankia TaxID=2994372 RepID=UPI0008D90B72|nr:MULTISPECIES: hypothetical protein [unclassified Pseudofrankia]MDT3442086.1 hypothetical protein [Pseudofrankia sp. BMG5.37]OHV47320.1 hypothetical protein BCD48_19685 [Pseudofrankia sp. BMG5.36]